MATDFFERQDVARRNTTRLVILFALAVLTLIVSIDLLLAAVLGYLGRNPDSGAIDWAMAADPQVLVLAVFGTLLVVGGGSVFKIAQLRGGGHVVAEQLGGRLLNPDSTVPSEQQLLNVVQEMAIASGAPTPPVYLMDNEAGINAFAAGFTPGDAVIGVTRGAADSFTRDELQGVIAHEFSHILNGDMRLNIRLIGLLHGILIIGMLGYFVLRMAAFSGAGRSRSRENSSPLPMLALGAGLMAVGFFGTLFGNLIKAAVSRQREFLADASAVQFTRNPGGIAGALKRIGGAATGSGIESPNAPEASHMFFGRATKGFSGLFSTHPPLAERIRRIDPSWDGALAEEQAIASAQPAASGASAFAGGAATAGARSAGSHGVEPPSVGSPSVDQVGQPAGEAHIQYAARLVRSLPAQLVSAAHETYGARAVVYTLLLDREAEPRTAQLAHLKRAADPGVYEETLRLMPLVEQLDMRARLPLLDMSLPALRGLVQAQYELFKDNVAALVEADKTIDLFEWSLHRILLHDLEAHLDFVKRRPPRVRHRSVAAIRPHAELLLSMLAYAGHRDLESAQHGFQQAKGVLGLADARLHAADAVRFEALDRALAAVEESVPVVKRQVLRAAVACIAADRAVTATEAELLRAISASVGSPMPPLLVD
ncbi:MAG: M48 family metallopeptidase [Acidobacteria bacterium]|nr:M48 family metallopeptidase [Acidobacteriota bacterium]